MTLHELDVDNLIARLLKVRECEPGTPVDMAEAELNALCHKSREIFLSQPMLLEIEATFRNLKVLGRRRFSVELWKAFNDCFNCLPLAALISRKYFCCHGGLSPELHNPQQIRYIERPTGVPDKFPDDGISGWRKNSRGRPTYGPDEVANFLNRNNLELVCRSHQVLQNGYEYCANNQVVTIFSAPNYCGEFNNEGVMMTVNAECGLLRHNFKGITSRVKALKEELGHIGAPMKETILDVKVKVGDKVAAKQTLYVLSAMKMEMAVESKIAGIASDVILKTGETVEAEDLIIIVKAN